MIDCEGVRERVSASRDGEAGDTTGLDAHLRSCLPCRAWLDDLDRLTSRSRLGIVRAPDVTRAALAEWDRQASPGGRPTESWRWLLAVAGTASIVGSIPRLVTGLGPWLWGPVHTHHVRESAAVEVAVGVGFLLAAWRPARFSAGLVPVCAALVVLLGAIVAVDVLAGNTAWISELVHLPLAVGTVALGIVRRRSGTDPDRGAQRARRGAVPNEGLAA